MKRLKNNKIFIILTFIAMFIFGLFFLMDINANFDEFTEQDILKGNIMQYSQYLGIDELTAYFEKQGVTPIQESVEIDHGIAPYYLFAPLLLIKYISPHYVSILWHLYTYIIYFIGVIYFYKLIKYLFKKENVAIISTLLYFISPRILIDSLHNNKDIVFMSILIIMIYLGVKFIKERDLKNSIAFALVSGIECNIKILGFYFLFIIGMSYIIRMFIDKKFTRSNFLIGLLTAVLSLVMFAITTPAIWGNIPNYIEYCLDNSVNFRATTNVLFEGNLYNKLYNPLPWYYIPKYMLMTLPIIVIVLFVFSVFRVIANNIRRRNTTNLYYINTISLIYLIPLLICIISRPNLYNGWRHFYFLYGGVMILVSYIIYYFCSSKNKKIVITIYVLAGLSISASVLSLIKYGVGNTCYFNALFNNNISSNYELDYYGVTTKKAIEGFLESDLEYDKGHKIYLYGEGFNIRVISDYLRSANFKSQQHLILIDEETYKNRISRQEPVYLVCNTLYSKNDTLKYNIIYNYKYRNNSIIKFYRV